VGVVLSSLAVLSQSNLSGFERFEKVFCILSLKVPEFLGLCASFSCRRIHFFQRNRKKNFHFFEIVVFVAHIFSEKCPEKLDTFQKSSYLRQHFFTKPRQVLAGFRKKLCPMASLKQLTLQLL